MAGHEYVKNIRSSSKIYQVLKKIFLKSYFGTNPSFGGCLRLYALFMVMDMFSLCVVGLLTYLFVSRLISCAEICSTF